MLSTFARLSLLLLLVVFTAAAQAADPPVIVSVEPSAAPSSGGLPITILGHNFGLPGGFACILPCPPRVRFGDAEMAAFEYTDEKLVVLAPPHTPGTVDVTVITGDGRTVTRPSAFTYSQSAEESWEKILIPIYFERQLPGSGGSLWETQFRLRAAVDTEIAPVRCDAPCPAIYPPRETAKAGETWMKLPNPPDPTEGRGRIIFVSKNAASELAIQARVTDLSRGRVDAGTDIPIVRSRQLRATAMQLLNVPFDPVPFRYRLRIYETSNIPSQFRVRVFDETAAVGASPLVEFNVEPTSAIREAEFRFEPFYYETDLGPLVQRVLAKGTLRVEVAPLGQYSQSWAMITITSVETNHVTVVAPN